MEHTGCAITEDRNSSTPLITLDCNGMRLMTMGDVDCMEPLAQRECGLNWGSSSNTWHGAWAMLHKDACAMDGHERSRTTVRGVGWP